MLRSWKLGSAFGIGIYVNSTFLLLPILVFFFSASSGLSVTLFFEAMMLSVFVCVVLHELGHALMARWFGIATRDITLFPIGGVARLERMSERPWEEFCIALAGPAVNVLIAGSFAVLWIGLVYLGVVSEAQLLHRLDQLKTGYFGLGDVPVLLMLSLPYANVGLFGFNMLPAFPMDGGRVLRAGLSPLLGRLAATEIAAALGLIVASLMALLGLGFFHRWLDIQGDTNPLLAVVGLFVMFAGQQELHAVRVREAQRRGLLPSSTLEVSAGPPEANFSGFTWDHDHHCWIEWRAGQPIHACRVAPE